MFSGQMMIATGNPDNGLFIADYLTQDDLNYLVGKYPENCHRKPCEQYGVSNAKTYTRNSTVAIWSSVYKKNKTVVKKPSDVDSNKHCFAYWSILSGRYKSKRQKQIWFSNTRK